MFEKRYINRANRILNKRGQVTIFIIIAIILVASVAAFFIVRNVITVVEVPANLEPAYNSLLACIEEDASVGISVLEAQGGYIDLPEFEPGSSYMPFSSQLNFLGNPIPYWYYVSGNNIQKEKVPTKTFMEEELGRFVSSQISNCVLDEWYGEGYTIIMDEEAEADVTINDADVSVILKMPLRLEKANDTVLVSRHEVVVESELGKLYDSAREIYDYEQETMFLENYAIDTLRLYAPVDGVELECSPLVWNADDVFSDLEEAIEANTLSLKVDNPGLTLANEEDKYFVVDVPVDNNVRFINSRRWPHGFDVNPTENGGSAMIAKPIGNNPGMSMMGFCYVPYHFVYNVRYPVLVQVYSDYGIEVFQFPFAVVIEGNKPREALEVTATEIPKAELCEHMNTETQVNVFDSNLNSVEADISYQCFGEMCSIGTTSKDGSLVAMFPECINGYVLAKADGFKDTKQFVASTIYSQTIDVLMNRLFEQTVNLRVDGKDYNGEAVIVFNTEDSSDTVLYPGQKTVDLSEGQYEVQVYIYKNGSIKLEETTQEQCMDVPQTGFGGLFGLTEEKCFDITIPAQEIESSLMGGGTQNHYILESELGSSSIIDINADSLPTPVTAEDLQKNYLLFEEKGLDIDLR